MKKEVDIKKSIFHSVGIWFVLIFLLLGSFLYISEQMNDPTIGVKGVAFYGVLMYIIVKEFAVLFMDMSMIKYKENKKVKK